MPIKQSTDKTETRTMIDMATSLSAGPRFCPSRSDDGLSVPSKVTFKDDFASCERLQVAFGNLRNLKPTRVFRMW